MNVYSLYPYFNAIATKDNFLFILFRQKVFLILILILILFLLLLMKGLCPETSIKLFFLNYGLYTYLLLLYCYNKPSSQPSLFIFHVWCTCTRFPPGWHRLLQVFSVKVISLVGVTWVVKKLQLFPLFNSCILG